MAAGVPHRVGLYLGAVQFLFALTWTVYVIFLPKLAAQAGIARSAVVLILLLDQLIFAIADLAMGMAADRVSRWVGRLGHAIVGVTLVSCAAFVLLPFAAPSGAAWLFLLLVVAWAITSSALRAPTFILIGKYATEPAVPWLSALALFGLGIAGAVSPYLTIALRDADPRLPFVLSSIALALTTLGIARAERSLARSGSAASTARVTSKATTPRSAGFLLAALLLGLGFQIHFSLNSAPLYLRHVRPDALQYLMPVFWIGFNVFMLPASLATRRYGGLAVGALGAFAAALGSFGSYLATDLDTLLVMQLIAGGGWGCVLMSAVSAAIALGRSGSEGRMTGAFFSLLAVAAFTRIAIVAAELNKTPASASLLIWVPVAMWAGAAVVLMVLARRPRPLAAATTP